MPDPSIPTVLVAEDDPVFRHLLQFTIQRAGYNVIAVADGESAWEQWQQSAIDLVVTDHQMPRCSGLELIQRIQQPGNEASKAENDHAIIFCTAKGLELDRQSIQDQFGLLAVLGKPFSPKQLTALIDQHFDSSCESHHGSGCDAANLTDSTESCKIANADGAPDVLHGV